MFRIILRVALITTVYCIGVSSYTSAQAVKPIKANTIAPVTPAQTVKPIKANTIAPVTSANQVKLNHVKIQDSALRNINFFIRKWKSGVSGAAYETKDIVNNKNTITTSPGTAKIKPL